MLLFSSLLERPSGDRRQGEMGDNSLVGLFSRFGQPAEKQKLCQCHMPAAKRLYAYQHNWDTGEKIATKEYYITLRKGIAWGRVVRM